MAFSFKVSIMWNYTLTSLRLCLVPENTKEIKNKLKVDKLFLFVTLN